MVEAKGNVKPFFSFEFEVFGNVQGYLTIFYVYYTKD